MECQWCPECPVYPPILSISPPALKPLEGAETVRSHSTSRPSFSILCIHETISLMYSTNVNNEKCVSRFLALASSHRLLVTTTNYTISITNYTKLTPSVTCYTKTFKIFDSIIL